VKAIYEVSVDIAKQGKPFMDGEYIKSCMMKIVGYICPEKKKQFRTVSLSKQTITRCVKDRANNLHQQLQRASKKFAHYSVALDQSTDVSHMYSKIAGIRKRGE